MAQLKIRPLNCATALSKDSWLSIIEYLRQSFEVFHSSVTASNKSQTQLR